jgi:ABC-2 type transport system ATP-binding protein
MLAIRAENVGKTYRDNTRALKGIDLEVESGRIFTFLGRNGAGKTTFIRIAGTQLLPTSGKITVFGHDVIKDADKVRTRIAMVPQEGKPITLIKTVEHIYYFCRLRGFSKNDARKATTRVLRELGLEEHKNKLAGHLSGGLKQKVLVAMVIASGADLLFLDEPTAGLDPVARRQVWDAIRFGVKEGQTVFLTTHSMEEAEVLSHDIAIIDEGRIIASSTLNELKSAIKEKICAEITGDFSIEEASSFGRVSRVGNSTWVYIKDEGAAGELTKAAIKRASVNVRSVGLEDVFLEKVGGGIEKGS